MHIAVLQNQPHIGAVDANLAAVQSAVEDVAFDLLVLPELFATGYFFHDQSQVRRLGEQVPDGLTTRFLMELAAAKKALVCGGLVDREGDRFYNSAVLVGPEGFIGCYRKLHLFYEEKLWFAPGDRPLEVYDWGTARIGMMVCYDWRFPEVARVLALKGAQVLLHPTNLVQPYCQDAMITRCLENRVFAVTANRVGSDTKPDGSSLTFTGRSQVVSPRGEVLCRTNVDDETVLTVDIDPGEADDKLVTEHNHLLSDRRPEYYDPVTGKQL